MIRSAPNSLASETIVCPTVAPALSAILECALNPLALRCAVIIFTSGPETMPPSTDRTRTASDRPSSGLAALSARAVSVLPFQATKTRLPIVLGTSSLTSNNGRPLSKSSASAVLFQSMSPLDKSRCRTLMPKTRAYSPRPSGPVPIISVQPARRPSLSRDFKGMPRSAIRDSKASRAIAACCLPSSSNAAR